MFWLVSSTPAANFKVVITEAILSVRRVKVASSIILEHAATLKHSSAKKVSHSQESTVKYSLFQEDLAVLPGQHLSGSNSQARSTGISGHRSLQWELP